MSVGAAPPPYHLLPSPSQRLFCPWKGQSLMLVLWKHGALWICPILSPSFLAMQSRIACVRARTHTHTHTHTHTGKYTKPALSPPFAVSVLFWRDGPQPQSFKQLSASLELTGQLVDCSRKYRSSPRSWAGMLSSTPEPGYASPGPPYFTADLELARSPDTACQLL